METIDIIHVVLRYTAIAFYLFAGASLVRVYKQMDKVNATLFLVGTVFMLSCLFAVIDDKNGHRIIWALADIIGAYAYFHIARNYKAMYFNFFSQIKQKFDTTQKKLLASFNDDSEDLISKGMLDNVPFGVPQKVNPKVEYEKKKDAWGKEFFETRIMAGGKFGGHFHDVYERCIVDQGVLVCPHKEGQKEFGINEEVEFAPYEVHSPHSNVFTRIRVYFYDTPIIKE